MKYCSECGEKLEAQHKFCPNCGREVARAPLNNTLKQKNDDSENREIISCDICGEENSVDSILCESCGAKLKGKSTVKETKARVKPTIRKETVKREQPSTASDENKLDMTKVIYVAIGIVAILLLVVYTSGIFDTVPTQGTTQSIPQDNSSRVNLNNIQRINELESQVKNNPENSQLLVELAHLKNDSGLYEQAITDYKKYLELKPKDADARIDMGVCYYNLRQYDNAIAEMKQALEYSPNHQIGHLNLGIVNLASGNMEESKKWLAKAVSINPESEIGKKAQELLQSH